jgi:hypothetical protein
MKRLYISGPISHHDLNERKEAFSITEKWLNNRGFQVCNPMKNGLSSNASWSEHMRTDLKMLLKCDAIYMMDEWFLSKGCKMELDVASSCDIKILMSDEDVELFQVEDRAV